MRTLTESIEAFAHCPDPRCDGYTQQPVKGVRETVEHTYIDSGGDMPGVEKSMEYVHFATDDDGKPLDPVECPACGHAREISDQKRTVLVPLSGHAQDGLLQFKAPDGTFKVPEPNSELEELKAQVAELTRALVEQRSAA